MLNNDKRRTLFMKGKLRKARMTIVLVMIVDLYLEVFLGNSFQTLKSFKLEHPTPFGTVQQFSFLWSQRL